MSLYKEDIEKIYSNNSNVIQLNNTNKTVIDKVDNDLNNNLKKVIITNHEDFLSDDSINYSIDKLNTNLKYNTINNYLTIPETNIDILSLINILTTLSPTEYQKHFDYFKTITNEILIKDISLEGILGTFFNVEYDSKQNQNDMINMFEMGIMLMYGADRFIRKSIIHPPVIAKYLTNAGFKNIQMMNQGHYVLIRANQNESTNWASV